jgi:hypothetical protein
MPVPAQPPRISTEKPADAPPPAWAVDRAVDIIADAHRLPFKQALELIALRLALAHQEGCAEGMAAARKVIGRAA